MTAVQKITVTIPLEAGVSLSAWLFLPVATPAGQLPALTLAHGYAATKYHHLERFACYFAEAGFVVLVHDHRGFGDSSGVPRQDVDPWQQIADWRKAISYLESRPEVNPARIGIWGSSYAGGHALVLGATDRRLRAVVAQVPTISGIEQGRRRVSPEAVPVLERWLDEDERAQFRGEPVRYLAVADENPAVAAAYAAPDAVAFYQQPLPVGKWENKVTVRSTRRARMYEPGRLLPLISPTPLLLLVSQDDQVTLTDVQLAAYNQALEPKQLLLLPGGHFAPYVEQFDQASQAALAWFAQHLATDK